jgi:hypothetical protein
VAPAHETCPAGDRLETPGAVDDRVVVEIDPDVTADTVAAREVKAQIILPSDGPM